MPSPTFRAQARSFNQSSSLFQPVERVVEFVSSFFGENCHLVEAEMRLFLPFGVSVVDEPLIVNYVNNDPGAASADNGFVQYLVELR